jgi:methyl acetate hydrolase
VLTGFDGDTPVLRPPARQATVKNLVTHTSGLGYWFWSEDLVKWESVTGIPNVVAGSATCLTAPMLADPGTAFIYGINIDWLGKVVEAVTGVGLDVAIKQGITGPLGMDQTTFLMNDEQRPNSTPVHVKAEDGTWTAIGEVLNQAPDYWAGGHGLDLAGMRRAWSGSWAGLCNTHFWVDRTTGVCGSIYSNFLPFVTPEAFGMYNDFERALYASL